MKLVVIVAMCVGWGTPSLSQPVVIAPSARDADFIGPRIPLPEPEQVAMPVYPDRFQSAHIRGNVVVSATITEGGATTEIRVVEAVHPVLAASCLEAVDHWRFKPLAGSVSRPIMFTFKYLLTSELGFHGAVYDPAEPPFTIKLLGTLPPIAPIN